EDLSGRVGQALADLNAALDDDLNVPSAMAAVFELVRDVNVLLAEGRVGYAGARQVLDLLADADSVLGIIEHEKGSVDAEIEALIAERQQVRADRNFSRADEIRDELLARGIAIEDTPQGPRWRREG
ncbi:MAG TPA: DALR domain-containing protein, partial [Armatimonadota bacterium]|nr:DALR domain-containing protein [Armatimonadota bacterium]